MTPQAEGSYFGPKHLEQMITSYLHFTQNRPRQAKATLGTTKVRQAADDHSECSGREGNIWSPTNMWRVKYGVASCGKG